MPDTRGSIRKIHVSLHFLDFRCPCIHHPVPLFNLDGSTCNRTSSSSIIHARGIGHLRVNDFNSPLLPTIPFLELMSALIHEGRVIPIHGHPYGYKTTQEAMPVFLPPDHRPDTNSLTISIFEPSTTSAVALSSRLLDKHTFSRYYSNNFRK